MFITLLCFFFCQFIFWSVVNVCFWQVRAKEQENLELQSEMADARKKHEVCNGLFIHILRPPYVCMCSRNVILFDNYYATIYPPQKNSYLREIWGRLIIIFWLLKHLTNYQILKLTSFLLQSNFTWIDDFHLRYDSYL